MILLFNKFYFLGANFLLIPATIMVLAGFINKKNFTLSIGLFFAVLAYFSFEVCFKESSIRWIHIAIISAVIIGTGVFVKLVKDWK